MVNSEIERLRDLLQERFPDGSYKLLKAQTETGGCFLDVNLQGYALTIEWRPGKGFGLSTPTEGDAFLGPDEVYTDLDSAYERAKVLLLSQTPTKAPVQSARSRLARPSDMLVGTLRNAVADMGGELYLVARFPDETVYIDLQSEDGRNGSGPRPQAWAERQG